MDWKKAVFWIERQKQVELFVKLYQDGYKRQGEFMRDIVDAYLNEDPEFNVWMNKKRLEKGNNLTKLRIDRKEKLIKKAKELEDILFSEHDLNNIFDLIESDK